MYTFVTELQKRPDGLINSTITSRSSLAMGLALFYQRASVAVSTKDFLGVSLTLQNENGEIIKNQYFNTLYEYENETEEVETDTEPLTDTGVETEIETLTES